MKNTLRFLPVGLLSLTTLVAPSFAQEASHAEPAIQIQVIGPIDSTVSSSVAGIGEAFSATQGSSEYVVTLNWTVYQQYLWGTHIDVTLYRNDVQIYFNQYPATGFGYGWTQTYYDVVGPGKSYTYKLVRHCWDGAWLNDWWQPTYTGSTSAIRTPTNLSVTNSTNSDKTIQMSWTNASDLTQYFRIYENSVQIATTTATSYTVNTTPGKSANWGVATYAGSYGNSAIVQSLASTSAFHRPENFFASEDTTVGYVRLGWTCASDYATHVQIFRDDSMITTIPFAQKWYLDSLITYGQRYKYQVRSYNSSSGLWSVFSDTRFGQSAMLKASDGVYGDKVYVYWNGFPAGYKNELRLYRDGTRIEGVYPDQRDKNDELATPGKVHKYVLDVVKDNQVVLSISDYGFSWASGEVKGLVTTPSGTSGVKNVEMRAYSNSSTLNKSINFDGIDDRVVAPPLFLYSNAVTMTAWVKRNGAQTDWSGIVNSRARSTAAGLLMMSTGELRYNWNNSSTAYQWSSGLIVPDGIWTFIALVVEPDKATMYMNDSVRVNPVSHAIEEFDGITEIGRDNAAASRNFKGMINEVRIWKGARTREQIKEDRHHILVGNEPNLMTYWRFGQSNVASDFATGGNHHGTLLGSPSLVLDAPPVWHYGMTGGTGSYTIPKINWQEGDYFTVRPFKAGHGFKGSNFQQDSIVLQFTSNEYKHSPINFLDTTSIEVSGWVYLKTTPAYPLPGVKILINGQTTGESSDSSGHFSTNVSEAGRYTVSVEYLNHKFVPPSVVLDIQDPVTNLVFQDTTRRTIGGRVYGGCDNLLGTADIRIKSLAAGYVDTTVQTDAGGMFRITLPSHKYIFQLTRIMNADSVAIITYFSPDTVDISQHDTTHDYEYHSPPIVRISDLPPSGSGVFNVPITEMERTYAVHVHVVEKYGELECPVSEGTVHFTDYVAYENPDSTIALVNGQAYYPLTPGYPNISGGGAHPYQKQFIVTTNVDKYTRHDTVWVFVRGHKPRAFQFSTVTPEIPLMILRDPPGDKSYSYLTTSGSVSVTLGLSFQADVGIGVFLRGKLGGGGEIPGKGSTGTWVGGSVEAKAGLRTTLSGSQQIKISASQTLKTSDADKILGPRGDVFLGAALNVMYALTDIVDYDTVLCTAVLDTGLAWNGDGFKTTYLYTESHIRNSVIPGLQTLAAALASSEDEMKRDSAEFVLNQINVWEQVLARNDELKANAIHLADFPSNVSFSAGTSMNASATVTSTTSFSIEMHMYIETEVAGEVGFKSGDFQEIVGGVKVFAKLDFGLTAGTSIEVSNTVGFELADDDADPPGDVFSVDILGDPTYCTPVFKLLGGSSSCPWEKGTLPREGVGLSMNTHVATGVPPEMPASFDLYLYNLTQTNETRTYKLAVVQGSNPDGAVISVGGAVLGSDELQFSLEPNRTSPQRATLRVSRVAGSVYDYENLKLHLYSACDSQFDTTVSFSVHFIKPCSDVVIAQPRLNWIANESHGGQMRIVLKGYNVNDPNMEQVTCEYRARGATDWTLLFSCLRALLPADSLVHMWNMTTLPEGAYELRASTICPTGTYSTRVHAGVYDHTPPQAFGNPQPADGSLDLGDDVKIVFTEAINVSTAIPANIVMRDLTRGVDIPINILCKGDEIVITAKVGSDLVQGDSLKVTVSGLSDVYGNVLSQPVIWTFKVNRTTAIPDNSKPIPTEFVLEQCHPNPFNPRTNIRFGIPKSTEVTLIVYDMKGREITRLLQRVLSPGTYEVPFDGMNLSSGIYLYMLKAGEYRSAKKMVLLK